MRKFFSLFTAILFAGSMMATTVTFSGADFTGGVANEGGAFSVTKDGVTLSSGKAYGTGSELRIYQGGTLTVTAEATITLITPAFGQYTKMQFDAATPNATTWSVEATSQIRLTSLEVTIEDGPAPAVATPVITGDLTFTDSVIVTMTCSTTGADIYYTTDGTTDPKCDCAAAPEYKKPIVIKETTTIKAAAYTGNDWSAVATKTFTKVEAPKNLGEKSIAEFLELKNTKDTCVLTGIVSNITNETYGNFDLVEIDNSEVSVYVYGLLTPEGESKKFEELDVEEGDTLTLKAVYSVYNNKPQAKNAVFVSVIKGEGGESGLNYDYEPTTVSTFDVTIASVSVKDYVADYGVITFELEDADGAYFAYLELISSTSEPATGTYPINFTEQDGTFYASPGGDDQYDYGCYFGVMDGEYYNPYYMVSGSVEIAEDGMTVNATSYNGSTIKLTYKAPEQAIDNTEVKVSAVKFLQNDQLIIEKNGVRYNVFGIRVR
jgi:hypothetical protein